MRTKPNDDGTESYVKNMKELCITDNVGPRSLSTHAINIYVMQNGHLKKTEEFERKFKCFKANTSNMTSPIMSINTNKVAATQPPKKKKKINEGEGNQARRHAPSTNKHPTTYQRYINAQPNPSTNKCDHKSSSQTSNDHPPRSSAGIINNSSHKPLHRGCPMPGISQQTITPNQVVQGKERYRKNKPIRFGTKRHHRLCQQPHRLSLYHHGGSNRRINHESAK